MNQTLIALGLLIIMFDILGGFALAADEQSDYGQKIGCVILSIVFAGGIICVLLGIFLKG